MSQLDAIGMSESIRDAVAAVALEEAAPRDPAVRAACRAVWAAQGGVVSELWVEGAFPARRPADGSRTLRELSSGPTPAFSPTLARHLDAAGAVGLDLPLYEHQRDAVQQAVFAADGTAPAMIVTAGTGAGKTETFLLPVLNRLWSTPRAAGAGGVRCVVLYPMNALVNDQVKRVYEWLGGQGDDDRRVRFVHMTSDTPENHREAVERNPPLQPYRDACRVRTRQEARCLEGRDGGPPAAGQVVPDVLVTNYSMLEYMLCRPQDGPFFGPALEAIVLDEAHLYTGTMAAEITLLLRRVLARCGRPAAKVLQVATSATLGTGDAGPLRSFAAALFSKPAERVIVLQGKAAEPAFPPDRPPAEAPGVAAVAAVVVGGPTLTLDPDGQTRLAVADDDGPVRRLAEAVSPLVDAAHVEAARRRHPRTPAAFLHEALAAAPAVQAMARVLYDKQRMPARDVADEVWGDTSADAVRATMALLNLTAAARQSAGDYPLIPHRIHLLVRSPQGLVVCMNGGCTAPAGVPRLAPFGAVLAGHKDLCPHCQHRTLALMRCASCGHHCLGGQRAAGAAGELWPVRADVRSAARRQADDAAAERYLLTDPPPPAEDGTAARAWHFDPATGRYPADGAVGPPAVRGRPGARRAARPTGSRSRPPTRWR